MGLFKKKNDDFDLPSAPSEDDLLNQLEEETAKLDKTGQPAMQKDYSMPRPGSVPSGAPSIRPASVLPEQHEEEYQQPAAQQPKPAPKVLRTEQVANLPIFMKVENYGEIVNELSVLATSLKNMEDIMNKVKTLEEEQDNEVKLWRKQVEVTKDQVRLLLDNMPETAQVKQVIGKKKEKATATRIRTEMQQVERFEKPKRDDGLKNELDALRQSINAIQSQIRNLNAEAVKTNLSESLRPKTTQLPDTRVAPQVPYQKKNNRPPWEN